MLLTRLATAAVAVPLAVLGILYLPTAIVALVFSALMLLGAWEWGGLLRLPERHRIALTLAVALAIFLVALVRARFWWFDLDTLLIGLASLGWLAAIVAIWRFPQGWAATAGRRDLGAAIGVIALTAAMAAVTFVHQSPAGPALLVLLFFLVWGADTGAYFAGRTMGRHKLAPAVSPNKTAEGAVGGLVTAMLLGGLGAWLLGEPGPRIVAFVLLGGWIAAMSVVGDLTLSMFKRHGGLKDSGVLFPGHGGVLDRLDSILAAAPWFVLGLLWLPPAA